MNRVKLNGRLLGYMKQFPTDATCWSQATDEVRDMCREIRLLLEEQDIIVDPADFRALRTPAQWNTVGYNFIKKNVAKLNLKNFQTLMMDK